MELNYMYVVILLCVFDATLGIQTYFIKRRDVQATSQAQCSVTSTLLDILKNDLNDVKKDNKKSQDRCDDRLKRLGDQLTLLEGRYDDQLKRLGDELTRFEDRYDDLVDKYSKLLQTTTNLQVKFANFSADKQVVSGRDCADLYKNGVKLNGVYTITPDNSPNAFNVYCDMTTDGGGWTLFQKRMDGSVDFYRGWLYYKHGFGNLNGEHWLGNEQINTITNQKRYELRVDMEDANGVWRYAHYDNFAIASEKAKYQLTVGAYYGTAGDSLSPHKGYPFTTKDRDNDASGGNCAQHFKGAWWYHNCHASNLNGLYHLGDHSSSADGVNWMAFRGHKHSLKTTEMKVRPVGFKSGPVSSG